MERPYFPMFVNLTEKRVLIAGGGKIALRRARTLIRFGASVHVTAPKLCGELEEMEGEGMITTEHRPYQAGDVEGYDLVLAATDDRAVNRKIWEECRERKIMVNVSDDKALCDFYFPSVVMTEDAVIGINSGGEDPAGTKALRAKIEELCGAKRDSLYH